MPAEGTSSDLVAGLCCLAVLLVLGVGLISLLVRRRKQPQRAAQQVPDPTDPYATTTTAELNQIASGKLIEADNALRTSEQELGFAVAQYGKDATKAFADALEAARADVAHAFQLRQQLDDDVPEDEPAQRLLLKDILGKCALADERLDAQADAFARLRSMESQAEQIADDLGTRLKTAQLAIPLAEKTWQSLTTQYSASALTVVDGNVEQAKERVEFADAQLTQARKDIEAANRPAAALRLRGAEQAIGQAGLLLDALVKVQKQLEAAKSGLTSLLADAQGQVAAGKAAMQAGTGGGADQMSLAAAVARAEQTIADIRTELAAPKSDPVSALRRVETVAGDLNATLGGIRDAAARAQQARTVLDQAMFSARSAIDSLTDFITTRRGAIGSQARTRLMEAQRQLDQASALAASDPVAALSSAQRASELAERATEAARNDLNQWHTGPVVISGGGGMGGAVLGGILIDSMFGGGTHPRRGGGYGYGTRIRLGFANADESGPTPLDDQALPDLPGEPGRFGGPSTWAR
ncbi:coiled-coil domain-containing protein [Catelliglobosispora koreensis]|uniref:hypothetical protein n=1 Tax=Catelliglobosispora koreensis TaxID=129052 RepID=UPI0012FA3D0A|nr:hypothetical protein [Catelliglobosispora koreensis]